MEIELYKHNKKAYESVLEHLKKSNKTCVIHPTGTGKSFISLKYLFDNKDKKCLFMAPTDAIVGQIKTHIEDSGLSLKDFPNLDFCLYASADKVKNKKYDCIVFDEFHRIGADIWGSNVKELLENNKEAKVLGVSATPIRYLDDKRDMSKEIFNGDVASEMTLADAIVRRILPVPTYISSVLSFQSDIDEIQKQINNYKNKEEAKEYQKLLDKAKKMLENSEGLEDIFFKNIHNKNGKFIVFCSNYEHMKDMEEKCKEWFKKVNLNIEMSEVYSKQGRELNQYYIDYFENNEKDTLKLLFSIEMLNEGLHVKDIDGVIMFRPTESPIIYLQQLGRALSVGHNDNPLIFDIVNNYESIDSIINLKDEVEKRIDEIIDGKIDGINRDNYPEDDVLIEILKKFKILEENKNLIDLLNQLKQDTLYTWEDWYALAKSYYEKNGNLKIIQRFKTTNGYEYDENGVNLGQWITDQRRAYHGRKKYGKITSSQIQKLKEIGMRFENLEKMNWEDWYALAKAYFGYHGNLEIKSTFKTTNGYEYDENGVNLGQWICTQRYASKGKGTNKINDDQIQKLKKIGMRFEDVEKMNWEDWYALAKAYYEHHGNLNIPATYKTKNGYEYDENGVNLGNWIAHKKQAYQGKGRGKITSDQIQKLKEIGMKFENKQKNWENWYALAKAYYEHHGNLEIPKRFKTINGYEYNENGVNLGNWIYSQKKAYQGKGQIKIVEDQIQKLEYIGMVWFADNIDKKFQKEDISEKNKLEKQKEILNRVHTLLNNYDGNSLPNKEEINNDFMEQLNRKK